MKGRPPMLRLRRARTTDADILLGWANDPATREASFGRARISRSSHRRWLGSVLADPGRRLWVAEIDRRPVGQVRVDRQPDGVGVVSIAVAPEARGRGVGGSMLRLALATAFVELRIRRARAIVRSSNPASLRLFEGAGFAVVGHAGDTQLDGLVLEADVGPGSSTRTP